jgi:FAD/FMN-containing dehydrogenase
MTTVLTLEAGVQWFEAYDAARQRNRVIVGGFCGPRGSIGAAGGWIQGGGHSPLSANYGLGNRNSPCSDVLT